MPETSVGLLELAARVEAATGPDRRIDRDIFHLVVLSGRSLTEDEQNIRTTEARRGAGFLSHIKSYTASLDAAMGLVPEGGFGSIVAGKWPSGKAGFCVVVTKPSRAEGEAATPALALTAACLRARATVSA